MAHFSLTPTKLSAQELLWSLPIMLAPRTGAPVQVQPALPVTQFPEVPGKAGEDDTRGWAAATHTGDS